MKIPPLFLLIIVLFVSCSKSANKNSNGGPLGNGYLLHVENFVEYDSTGKLTGKGQDVYTYNKAGNTVVVDVTDTFLTQILSYKTTYTFSGNTLTTKYSNSANSITYYLNLSDSIPDSVAVYTNSVKDVLYYTNNFDVNNKIASQVTSSKEFRNGVLTSSSPNSTITYTWQNNNLTKQSGDGFSYTFTYYPSNFAAVPDVFYFIVNPFYKVTGSKNIKESQDLNYTTKDYYTHYDYVYDDEGRVLKSTQTDKNGHLMIITAVTYY